MDANLDPWAFQRWIIFLCMGGSPSNMVLWFPLPRHQDFDRERIAVATPEDWNSFFSDWPTDPMEHTADRACPHHRTTFTSQAPRSLSTSSHNIAKIPFFSEQTWEIYAQTQLAEEGALNDFAVHLNLNAITTGLESTLWWQVFASASILSCPSSWSGKIQASQRTF